MIRLRGLPARWLLPALLFADLALVYSRGPQWRGSWMWTVDWVGGAMDLMGPMAAGVAATTAAWQRRTFAESAASGIDRPRWVVTGLGSLAAWVLGVHAAVLAQALVFTATLNPRVDWGAIAATPVQFVVLAGFLGAGWAIGQFLGAATGGLVAAVGAFVIQFEDGWLLPDQLFDFGGATGDISDLGFRGSALLALILFGLAMVAAAIATPVRGRRPALVRLAVGAGSVGLLAASIPPAQADDYLYTSPQLSARCEPGNGFEVCLASTLEFARDEITDVVADVVALERGLGVRHGPTMVIQAGTQNDLPHGFTSRPGQRLFGVDAHLAQNRAELASEMSRSLLYDLASCNPDDAPPGAFDLEIAVATWVLQRLGSFEVDAGSDEPLTAGSGARDADALRPDQARRIIDAYGACDLASLGPLVEEIYPAGRR